MQLTNQSFLSVILTLSLSLSVAAQAKRDVHFVGAGESLEQIAERFLGDADAAGELRAYNQLGEGAAISEGLPLVIPGQDRTDAVEILAKAEEAMKAAVAANSAEYAQEQYKKSVDVMNAAVEARKTASYVRAKILGETAIEQFALAIQSADANAMKPEGARQVFAAGQILRFNADSGDWVEASAADALGAGTQIRVEGQGSRVVYALPGGDRVVVQGPASLVVEALQQDQRNQRVDAVFHLVQGELDVSANPEKAEGSTLIVRGGGGEARLDAGTHRVVATGPDAALVAVIAGSAGVLAGEQSLRLGAGESLALRGGTAASSYALPVAPVLQSPGPGKLKTSRQVIDFTWTDLAGRPTYLVELSADPEFHETLVRRLTREATYRSDVLNPGKYFFRVSAIVNGVQGGVSDVIALTIGRNLDTTFTELYALKGEAGQIVAPGSVVQAVPASEDNSVASVEYSIDGRAFEVSESGVKLPNKGTFKVRARGVGADGSKGAEIEATYTVDGQAPELRIHIGEVVDFPGYGLIRSLAVLVDDDNSVGSIQYSINGSAAQGYELPLKLSVSQAHDLKIEATDVFGNLAVTEMTLKAAGGAGGAEQDTPEKQKKRKLLGIF